MTMTDVAASELFRRPAEQHVDVPGGAVAVRSIGSGPDVLFVHGWPASGATFRRLLPRMTSSVRCQPSGGCCRA
jgi:haloalkane dehalogenase